MDWNQFDPEGAIRQRYLDIDELTDETRDQLGLIGLSFEAFLGMYDISWIYHENGLEGVVLAYPEIRSAVDNKVVSDVSLLPTYRDVKAQKSCIDLVRDKALTKRGTVTIKFLKSLHGLVINNPEMTGVYRKDIPIHRTYFHEIAQPVEIEQRLTAVLDYMNAKRDRDTHPIEFAANVHHRFLRVFPFSKHSGMIGRLMLNYCLTRSGYIPAVIHATDRQRYYEALRGEERGFREFLCETIENGLENSLRFLRSQEKIAARG